MTNSYLRFWGVRGSYAAPQKTHLGVGGNTSCVEIRSGDHLLVCDGGTGIIPLGEELMANSDISEMLVVFTHYHWDHICGLPFFQPAFSPQWKIKLFGPGESAEDIESRLSNQMKAPYFPVETETWMADIEYISPSKTGITHGPMSLSFHNVHHPGVTYGYRIKVAGKNVIYVSDNEIDFLKSSIERRRDEFDDEDLIYSKLDAYNFVFEGKTTLKDFYRVTKIEDDALFESHKGESETIAGFVLEIAQGFPKRGAKIIFNDYVFNVESLDKKRLRQIKVTLPQKEV